MIEFEKILLEEKPDLIIVVGDVNSTVACTLTAVKLGIEVAHIESGLRSFDRKMPEEINRIITDSICDYCFVTEESGRLNLIIENTPEEKIFFVGNTMIDSSFYALPKADKSDIMEQLKVEKNNFALATIHRPSNVDDKIQFTEMLTALAEISEKIKVIFPIHPRSRKNLDNFGLSEILKNSNIILTDPLGYIEFLALMKNATMVLTDSGGIQEETTALKVPCITLRTTTERPVTCEIGTNILIMPEKEIIIKTANDVLNGKVRKGQIPDLWDGNAAERIVEVIKNTIFK